MLVCEVNNLKLWKIPINTFLDILLGSSRSRTSQIKLTFLNQTYCSRFHSKLFYFLSAAPMNGKNAFNVPMNVCRSLSALDPPMNFHFAFLLKFEANLEILLYIHWQGERLVRISHLFWEWVGQNVLWHFAENGKKSLRQNYSENYLWWITYE